ncbi:hypothetical protein Pmani_010114 [Petrolisthes manimaculis]|uniref:Uncharacterized protein n=1 Tax=Petrolisthes manimaculis TaxID=1843537 RepID=A0AAE1Q253_9EUCA|nr:hypothetical protein Pmani_010114 [Petrolisthes manimaculis]
MTGNDVNNIWQHCKKKVNNGRPEAGRKDDRRLKAEKWLNISLPCVQERYLTIQRLHNDTEIIYTQGQIPISPILAWTGQTWIVKLFRGNIGWIGVSKL